MRKAVLIAAKLLLTAALFWFAVRGIHPRTLAARLQQADPAWLGFAFAITLLQSLLVGIRWKWIVEICGATLSDWQAIRFNFIGMFFNQAIPSNLGGDAVRVWLSARAGVGWSKAVYSVLLDRFIALFILAVLVTGGLYWSYELIQDPIGRLAAAAVGFGSLAAGCLFLALGRWQWLQRWRVTRHLAQVAELARRILLSRTASLPIIGISLLIHTMTAATAWSLGRAVHSPFEFIHGFLLVLPVMLLANAPISIAGWGVRESALVLAFSYAGLPRSDGLIISVLLGLMILASSLVGGVLLLTGERLPRTIEPAESAAEWAE